MKMAYSGEELLRALQESVGQTVELELARSFSIEAIVYRADMDTVKLGRVTIRSKTGDFVKMGLYIVSPALITRLGTHVVFQ